MNKAEEREQSVYPAWRNGIGDEFSQNSAYYGFIEGYHRAEKDLELTCDDINIIINAFLDYKIESVKSGNTKKYTDEEYCKEVLKRFKDLKKNKLNNMIC